LDHVVAAGGGASIVLLERVDCFDYYEGGGGGDDNNNNNNNNNREYYHQNCKQYSSVSTSSSTSIWLRDLMREVESQHALFGSTIFVLTSQVGTTTMGKWTRKRLQSQAQQQQSDNVNERRKLLMASSTATAQMMLTSEIESMLRYEIRSYHSTTRRSLREDNNEIKEKKEDDNNGIHNDNGHDYLSVDDWITIPMAPLDRTAMKDILLRRIAAVTDETTSGIGNTAVDKNSIISNDYNPPIP